jgi:hypothetical protein
MDGPGDTKRRRLAALTRHIQIHRLEPAEGSRRPLAHAGHTCIAASQPMSQMNTPVGADALADLDMPSIIKRYRRDGCGFLVLCSPRLCIRLQLRAAA